MVSDITPSSSTSSVPLRIKKQERAKLAKHTINNVIPHILTYNKKAQSGVSRSKLVFYDRSLNPQARKEDIAQKVESADASALPSKGQTKITVIQSDTFDAVQNLLEKSSARVATLNMASALKPGGGLLHGSSAQEESLCIRSTLYASLNSEFYRLPETAAVYTPDVLVFRSADLKDLPAARQFFVDIISVAALKNPEVEIMPDGTKSYAQEIDRESTMMRAKLVLQTAQQAGARRLVLGALGCGAYGNPPQEIAKAFRRAMFGKNGNGVLEDFDEIVFAIFDEGENLKVFKEMFGDSKLTDVENIDSESVKV